MSNILRICHKTFNVMNIVVDVFPRRPRYESQGQRDIWCRYVSSELTQFSYSFPLLHFDLTESTQPYWLSEQFSGSPNERILYRQAFKER